MSNIIQRAVSAVRGATASKGLSVAEITNRQREAEQKLADLEAEHRRVALESVSGVEGAADRLATIIQSMAETRDSIAILRAASSAATERDTAQERAQRAALRKTQLNAVKQHLAARDEAALALSVAIENAAVAWKTLVHRSEKARAANPVGGEWPSGSMCEFLDLRKAVEEELYRCTGNPELGARDQFPGADASFDFTHRPADLPKLVDAVKAATAHTLAILNGRD